MSEFGQEGIIVGVQVNSPALEKFRYTLNANLGEPIPQEDLIVPLMTTGEISHYDNIEVEDIAVAAEPVARALNRAHLEGAQIDVDPGSLTHMHPHVAVHLLPTPELAFAKERTARILSRKVGQSLSTQLGGLWLNLTEAEEEPDPDRINVINKLGRLPTTVFVTGIVNRLEMLEEEPRERDFEEHEKIQAVRQRHRHFIPAVAGR